MAQSAGRKRQVLLICDFGPGLPTYLLPLYDRMSNTAVTLVRRKFGDAGPSHLRVIQIPLTTTLGSLGKASTLRVIANVSSYVVAGSVVSLLAALRYHCTIVHSYFLVPQGLVGLVASLFSRSALIVTAVGSDVNVYSRNPMVRVIIGMLARWGTIVSVSLPIKAKLSAMGVESVYIPSFVDGEEFGFRPLEEKENLLLFVGSLVENKRPDLLIEAVAGIPHQRLPKDFRVRLIGVGPLKSSIVAMTRERGLQDMVSLEGDVEHDVVRDLMARALIYVSASTMEGTSFALIEAIASGCVVIASDIPGNSAIIEDHKNGLLFREGDSAALTAAIEEAISDQALCARLARNARRTFESNFDIASSAKLLSGLYARVERGRRPDRR
jgi:glycosyltransferase involved in cell wall biosynthesis